MATATASLRPEVGKFLDKSIHEPLVGGKVMSGSEGKTFETHDPGSGEKLATVPNHSARDVDAAVKAAQRGKLRRLMQRSIAGQGIQNG